MTVPQEKQPTIVFICFSCQKECGKNYYIVRVPVRKCLCRDCYEDSVRRDTREHVNRNYSGGEG